MPFIQRSNYVRLPEPASTPAPGPRRGAAPRGPEGLSAANRETPTESTNTSRKRVAIGLLRASNVVPYASTRPLVVIERATTKTTLDGTADAPQGLKVKSSQVTLRIGSQSFSSSARVRTEPRIGRPGAVMATLQRLVPGAARAANRTDEADSARPAGYEPGS